MHLFHILKLANKRQSCILKLFWHTCNTHAKECLSFEIKHFKIILALWWALRTIALTCSRADKSQDTFIPKSRQDATDGKIQSSIRYSVPDTNTHDGILPVFNVKHLFIAIFNCHSSARLTSKSSARCNFATSLLMQQDYFASAYIVSKLGDSVKTCIALTKLFWST